ncbi:hypothetical protein VKS41_002340 [Umbelopsis sp. WA50703]
MTTPRQHDHHSQTPRQDKPSPNSPEYPLTPAMSPEYQPRIRYGKHYDIPGVHRLIATDSFLNLGSSEDNQSDADTVDREVAAATAKLGLGLPHHSYSASDTPKKSKTNVKEKTQDVEEDSPHDPPHKPPSSPDRSRPTPRRELSRRQSAHNSQAQFSPNAERALENLQTDVTALTEQIDILRRGMAEKEMKRKAEKWTWGWLFKTTAKHAVVNVIILTILFLFLMKRRSPIAYAILAYLGPWWNDIWANLIRRVSLTKLLRRY